MKRTRFRRGFFLILLTHSGYLPFHNSTQSMFVRISLLAIWFSVSVCAVALGQSTGASTPSTPDAAPADKARLLEELMGTWEIDLRPSPTAKPYLKDFVISESTNDVLKGVFYGTPFTNGRIHTEWGKLYFAFTTGDGSGTYFTSGYVSEGKLQGMTYAQGRGFLMPWFSVRKK